MGKEKMGERKIATTVRLSEETQKRLRVIGAMNTTTLQQVMGDALEAWSKEQFEKIVERLKKSERESQRAA